MKVNINNINVTRNKISPKKVGIFADLFSFEKFKYNL